MNKVALCLILTALIASSRCRSRQVGDDDVYARPFSLPEP